MAPKQPEEEQEICVTDDEDEDSDCFIFENVYGPSEALQHHNRGRCRLKVSKQEESFDENNKLAKLLYNSFTRPAIDDCAKAFDQLNLAMSSFKCFPSPYGSPSMTTEASLQLSSSQEEETVPEESQSRKRKHFQYESRELMLASLKE